MRIFCAVLFMILANTVCLRSGELGAMIGGVFLNIIAALMLCDLGI